MPALCPGGKRSVVAVPVVNVRQVVMAVHQAIVPVGVGMRLRALGAVVVMMMVVVVAVQVLMVQQLVRVLVVVLIAGNQHYSEGHGGARRKDGP